jgi:hypothetical protein
VNIRLTSKDNTDAGIVETVDDDLGHGIAKFSHHIKLFWFAGISPELQLDQSLVKLSIAKE